MHSLTSVKPGRASDIRVAFSFRLAAEVVFHLVGPKILIIPTVGVAEDTPVAMECVDRTNLQATITNKNREAAPRLRRPGDPAREAHEALLHCYDCLLR